MTLLTNQMASSRGGFVPQNRLFLSEMYSGAECASQETCEAPKFSVPLSSGRRELSCSLITPGRGKTNVFFRRVENSDQRQLGFKHNSRRLTSSVQKFPRRQRNERNKICKYSERTLYIRRGSSIIRKKCDRTCPRKGNRSGLLQHVFPGAQKRRGLPSHFEPENPKHLPRGPSFQDGDPTVHNQCDGNGGLGAYNGSQRCLSACSSFLPTSQVPQILFPRSPLPVPCNAFWPCNCSPYFYETYVSNRGLPQETSNSDIPVSRRLVDKEPEQNITAQTGTRSSELHSETGPYSQFLQVPFGAMSGYSVPGYSVQFQTRSDFPIRGEVPENAGPYKRNMQPEICQSTSITETSGDNGISNRCDTSSKTAYAPSSVLPPVTMASTQGQPVLSDSCQGPSYPSLRVVEGSPEHIPRGPLLTDTGTQCDIMDRCISVGVGSPSRQLSDLGHLESMSEITTHQLVGNESNSIGSFTFSRLPKGPQSSVEMRQLNCSSLCEQTGGDEILSSLLSHVDDLSVVYSEGNNVACSTYSREEKCPGRRSVSRWQRNPDNRMVSETRNSEQSVRETFDTEHRSFCHQREQEAASVLLALSRPASMGSGLSESIMEGNVCVCLPSSSVDPTSTEKSPDGAVYNNSNSSTFSQTVMVPKAHRAPCGSSKTATSHRGHAKSKERSNNTHKSRNVKSGSLENFKCATSKTKFSSKAQEYIKQARRSSTRQMYGARLSVFRRWCIEQNVPPRSASVEQLANFFVFLYERRGCKASTIAGYRAAIATIHSGWRGASVSNNKHLSNLIKGIFNTSPSVKPLLPNWDLPSVLLALCEAPFEPLDSCELKFLTWKTVFLVATATASRVSELHALSVNPDNLRFENTGVRLIPNMQFLAKTQRIGKVWKPIFIPKFERFATEPKDLLLCPCRVLTEYVKRTKLYRQGHDNLFLTYQPGRHKAAAKSTLSRWIVALIKYVYESLSDMNLNMVRAHDTRRLSTSWALFNGASLTEILQAAHWANETTFTSFYLKDVCTDDNFARASLLKTAEWAKNRKRD